MSENEKELWRGKKVALCKYEGGLVVYDIKISGKDSKEPGKEILVNPGYYTDLAQALHTIAKRVAHRDAETLSEYVKVYVETSKMLTKATRGA